MAAPCRAGKPFYPAEAQRFSFAPWNVGFCANLLKELPATGERNGPNWTGSAVWGKLREMPIGIASKERPDER